MNNDLTQYCKWMIHRKITRTAFLARLFQGLTSHWQCQKVELNHPHLRLSANLLSDENQVSLSAHPKRKRYARVEARLS